jgi:RNA polymerase sigma-70 factor (ECF subfamily)
MRGTHGHRLTLGRAGTYDDLGMRESEHRAGKGRPVVYCLIPRDLAPRLHEQLRRHFADDPAVEVVVEQRAAERRRGGDRRAGRSLAPPVRERRRVRASEGRRITERRAALVTVDAPGPLPRRAREHARRLVFAERLEPTGQAAEDADTVRLVARIQAGDRDAFATLYMRYFDRVYGYLRILTRSATDAEDAAQQVFVQVLQALPGYEHRGRPFRAFLFAVAKHQAIDQLRRDRRLELMDSEEVWRHRALHDTDPQQDEGFPDWISDRDLMLFVERLPLAQRQVLVLRYMLGFSHRETAQILGRSLGSVTMLHARALEFLRTRLARVGRVAGHTRPTPVMRWHRQARTLRARRFALGPGGPVR